VEDAEARGVIAARQAAAARSAAEDARREKEVLVKGLAKQGDKAKAAAAALGYQQGALSSLQGEIGGYLGSIKALRADCAAVAAGALFTWFYAKHRAELETEERVWRDGGIFQTEERKAQRSAAAAAAGGGGGGGGGGVGAAEDDERLEEEEEEEEVPPLPDASLKPRLPAAVGGQPSDEAHPPSGKTTNHKLRKKVVEELVTTETNYVDSLFKLEVSHKDEEE
jgi:hypothetical protein